jgi:hypothetical protein
MKFLLDLPTSPIKAVTYPHIVTGIFVKHLEQEILSPDRRTLRKGKIDDIASQIRAKIVLEVGKAVA